ncbi:hypothetical protein KKE38_04985 [Candidatus Micrarchaeota archaeon]|nr:hypothetical protein [Candidatus Micrarchaeota archaeon]
MGRRELEQSRRNNNAEKSKKRFPKIPKMIGEGLLVLGMVGSLGACGAKMATAARVEQASGATLTEREALLESQVVLAPSADGRTLSAEVIVFEPASSTGGESIREVMEGIVEDCRGSGSMNECINDRAIEAVMTVGIIRLENPTLEFEYYNRETGEWESLNSMGLVRENECDISNLAPGMIRVRFIGTEEVIASLAQHEILNLQGTAAERAAGDVAEGRRIADSLVAAGRTLEMSEQELDQLDSRLPYIRGTAAMMVLQSGVVSGGQVQIDHERISVDGERMLRISANVTGEGTYLWLHYQSVGNDQLLLNPRYTETSQPRYSGMVMRNVTLTDGTTGDFVVRVYGNNTRPSQTREFSPIVESDGRVRAENVLYQLEAGGLVPEINSPFSGNLSQSARVRNSPTDTVHEYGATTSVVLIR